MFGKPWVIGTAKPGKSYCQKLVTRVSGGAFDWLFSVLEFDASNDLGEVVQYHFMADRSIRPYVGAGINLTVAYGEDAGQSPVNALGGPTNIKADNSIGWAVQAGVDIDLDDRWFFNLDIKYVAISVDVAITTPATSTTRNTTLDINPIIVGAGIGYRF